MAAKEIFEKLVNSNRAEWSEFHSVTMYPDRAVFTCSRREITVFLKK